MLKLKWQIINGEYQTTYKGFIIRSAKPQKWTRIYKKNLPYFKLLNPALKQPTVEYSSDFYSLIIKIENYKGKHPNV